MCLEVIGMPEGNEQEVMLRVRGMYCSVVHCCDGALLGLGNIDVFCPRVDEIVIAVFKDERNGGTLDRHKEPGD